MSIRSIILSFLVVSVIGFFFSTPVYAGTDITLTCQNEGPCTPNTTNPLFSETGMTPGKTFDQRLTIINNDADDTCNITLTTEQTSSGGVNLASQLFAGLTDGSTTYFGTVGVNEAEGPQTYQDLFALSSLNLGSLTPGGSKTVTWYATLDPNTGNEYQGKVTNFNFDLTVRCDGGTSPTTPPGPSGSSSSNNGGQALGATTQAQPPVCSATPPTTPVVSISTIAGNSVTLTWNSVAGATHYGILFTRLSDGTQYGASNVGNVTSYTVNNLSGGGNSYSFQVFAVNECAPSGFSNAVQAVNLGGPIIEGVPGGFEEVLGEEVSEPSQIIQPAQGEVLGATDTTCQDVRYYLPILLLALQVVMSVLIFVALRDSHTVLKHLLVGGITLLLTLLFYWARQCNCVDLVMVLALLCKWYWVVALVVALVIEALQYLFIEDNSK